LPGKRADFRRPRNPAPGRGTGFTARANPVAIETYSLHPCLLPAITLTGTRSGKTDDFVSPSRDTQPVEHVNDDIRADPSPRMAATMNGP
jgi:hypothetical protein